MTFSPNANIQHSVEHNGFNTLLPPIASSPRGLVSRERLQGFRYLVICHTAQHRTRWASLPSTCSQSKSTIPINTKLSNSMGFWSLLTMLPLQKRHHRTFSEDERIQAQENVKKVEDGDAGEISEPEDPLMLQRDAKDWKVRVYSITTVYTALILTQPSN